MLECKFNLKNQSFSFCKYLVRTENLSRLFYIQGQVFTLRIEEEELSFMPQSLAVPTEYKAEEKK